MKTTIEVNGYEIVIEESEGIVTVKAMQDDDVVEEFELETSDAEVQDDMDFEEFSGEEEEDFDSDESDDDEDDEDESDDNEEDFDSEEAPKLESFQSFLKRRK